MTKNILTHFSSIPIVSLPQTTFAYPPFPLVQFLKLPETAAFSIPNTILGKQAEAIFETLLQYCPSLTIKASNTQINKEKETIGELDYLLQNKENGAYYHVELACKFYLFDDANSTIYEAKWIGSNRKDTLYDKLKKMRLKQFPLLKHPATQSILKKLEIDANELKQFHYITSSFFIPKEYDVQLVPKAYQSCIVGTWQHFKDVQLKEGAWYAIPSKREWLLPEEHITTWMTAKEAHQVLTTYMEQRRAPMVYQKTGTDVIKFFVVWWAL